LQIKVRNNGEMKSLTNRMYHIDLKKIRSFSMNRWPKDMGTTHGVEHWDRVARFGRMLYQEGADMDVILAFAYLHDPERKDKGQNW
jgi:HD superfamily phosphodiesterase